MKTQRFLSLSGTLALALLSIPLFAQSNVQADSTGLPGDNFSLEAAIELFKVSDSPEDFEKRINAENNDANNLDLNEDGETDYIRVVDNTEGDVHALVLQVAVNENESQDVAVIEIEKQGAENALLQIVGDEALYGKEKIAEPFEEENGKSGKNKGPAATVAPIRIIVNVWFWRPVRFMYAPTYRVWASPYRWRAYPAYWRPWRPHPWRTFHVRAVPYRAHYHVIPARRVHRAHAVYAPHRAHSKVVRTRTTTKVVAPRGKNGSVVAKQSTTTTKRNGRVKDTKTTTKVARKGRNGNAGVKKSTTKTSRPRRH